MIALITSFLLSVFMPTVLRRKFLHISFGIVMPIVIIAQLVFIIYNGNYESFSFPYAVPITFSLTPIYAYFCIFICILWGMANVYTALYITHNYGERKLTIFMPFYNLSVCAALLITISGDLITTFIFYELLTIATLPLVGFAKNDDSRKSIVKYTFILSFTALALFLPAILILQHTVGTTTFSTGGTISLLFTQELSSTNLHNYSYMPSPAIMMLILVMLIFGVAKSAIFPFNGWLPAAMCAPAPVSALLHAVAVVKSGAFVTYKIIYELYGIQYFQYLKEQYGYIFIIITLIAVIGIIVASVQAIFAKNIKKILAFSTISNMTYIFLLFFAGTTITMQAGFWHIAVHGFTKIALFFIAGILYSVYHTNDYTKMSGAFNQNKILTFALCICVFSLMGMPFTSGFMSKQLTVNALTDAQAFIALFGIAFSSLATAIYLGKPLIYLNSKAKQRIMPNALKYAGYFVILPVSLINLVGFGFAFIKHSH